MSNITRFDGSFRDPAGYVHEYDGRIFRTVTKYGADAFEAAVETGFLTRLVKAEKLIGFERVQDPDILALFPDAAFVLEHPRLDHISYPYEWSFSLLKQAALLHLDIAIEGLDAGIVLQDATPYNIQFVGNKPVFIDHLSFRPYVEREYWMGHRQFCEQFLNPLLLRAKFGIAHNSWFRGGMEGIPNRDLAAMLRFHNRLSLKMMTHVILPAKMQRRADSKSIGTTKPISERRGLPRASYKGLMVQLRNWIASLEPKSKSKSTWGAYDQDNTYDDAEHRQKAEFVSKFVQSVNPKMLFDLGCNSGDYSEIALASGAQRVIGFDFDQISLEKAYQRSRDKSLNYLPLYLDASNPAPAQGWRQSERSGFSERANADAVMALAFEHHLAIGKNIPLGQVVDWIVSQAPNGIIEFVDKSDPTIVAMLAMREDIFHNYSQAAFEEALSAVANIVEKNEITKSGRTLYWYNRLD